LEVGAVVGRDVDLALLARAAGRSFDECLDAIEPAVVHRLLVAVDEQPGTYRFSHALVREVLVDGISSLRRARLHLRVADALDDTDDTAEILAEHLWEAAPIGVGARAADALQRAGRVAVSRVAYASADRLLERAVQLRRAAASSDADLDAELDAITWLVSVRGARMGYAALIDSPLLVRAKQLAEQLNRTTELAHLLWAEWAGLDVGCLFERADPIAAELLALAERSGISIGPAVGHTAYGISCWHQGRLVDSSLHLDRAKDAARALPLDAVVRDLFDLDQLKLSLPFSVYLHDLLGDLDDPERHYDEVAREA